MSVSAVHSPPRYNINNEAYIEILADLEKTFIAGGDFNAKHISWGSIYSSTKGRELLRAGESLHCSFLSSGSHSYWPTDINRYPDVIDFFVTKGNSTNFMNVVFSADLSSDYTSVILSLSDETVYVQSPPTLTNNGTNWEGYRAILKENIIATPRTEEQLKEE